MSHRCGQPRGQSHFQVSFESKQSWNQDENLCDVLERPPVLLVTGRTKIRLTLHIVINQSSTHLGPVQHCWGPIQRVEEHLMLLSYLNV